MIPGVMPGAISGIIPGVFAVGVCARAKLVDPARCAAGDVVLALASAGVHASGLPAALELVRECRLDLDRVYAEVDPQRTLAQVLLTPTISYIRALGAVLGHYTVKHVIPSIVHVDQRGLTACLATLAPAGLQVEVEPGVIRPPAVFAFLQRASGWSDQAMYQRFNGGIGMLVVVREAFAASVAAQLRRRKIRAWTLGRLR